MTEEYIDEYQTRLQKRELILQAGIIPYAQSYPRTHTIADIIALAVSYEFLPVETLMEH
jgi:hypothetical protein